MLRKTLNVLWSKCERCTAPVRRCDQAVVTYCAWSKRKRATQKFEKTVATRMDYERLELQSVSEPQYSFQLSPFSRLPALGSRCPRHPLKLCLSENTKSVCHFRVLLQYIIRIRRSNLLF